MIRKPVLATRLASFTMVSFPMLVFSTLTPTCATALVTLLEMSSQLRDISARRAANVEANVECTLRPWYDAHGPPTTEHERGMHAAAMLPKRALALAIPFLQLMHHG
ncbi:unnamed protein product [Prorocentrum cordatum]|uniref:Secreted protein n=1 Tax=Prorocentrum cordatum TaxID=2364126 RepID=A0ABN9TS04_9DINO|nr:unnamed protein product [Polarella glacialis]